MMKMKVSGVKELQATFEQLGKEISNILEDATAAGSMVVVAAAQENSAKGGDEFPHRVTGNLFRNIAEVSPAVIKKTDERCEMAVGSSMEYARRLEYGFSDTDSLGRKYNQPPRPFLRPALDENEAEVEEAIKLRFQKMLGGIR